MVKQSRIDMNVGKKDLDILQDNKGNLDDDIIKYQEKAKDCDFKMRIKTSMKNGFLTGAEMARKEMMTYSFTKATTLENIANVKDSD